MEKIMLILGMAVLAGCVTPQIVYKEVKVPVPVPCKVAEPHFYELPIVDFNELTVRDAISRKEYGEITYWIGSSLVQLNGDVKSLQEALGACR